MRIAMISEHASPLAALGGVDAGGQNAHVAELAGALAAAGHQVRVYTRRDSDDLPTVTPMGERLDVVHVPAGPATVLPKDELLPFMGAFAEWLAQDWRTEWRPDVAHAHFWMSGLAAVTAGRRCEVPVLQTYHALGSVKRRHQGSADTSPPRRIAYERELGRAVDRVIVQCRDEVRELLRLGVPRSRMTLVPSGVNVERFSPDGPSVARDEKLTRILTVARLVERKGVEDLVRALPAVPDAELVVVGGPLDGELAAKLRRVAAQCGVTDRVELAGAVPSHEMPLWYRSADIVAATPWYEPFGLTVLEAMACGVPVVASAVGGLADTVVEGVTGDLVPARDPARLAVTLRKLAADDVRRFSYSAAAVDRALYSYSWPRIADRLAHVYASVAGVTTESTREAVA